MDLRDDQRVWAGFEAACRGGATACRDAERPSGSRWGGGGSFPGYFFGSTTTRAAPFSQATVDWVSAAPGRVSG